MREKLIESERHHIEGRTVPPPHLNNHDNDANWDHEPVAVVLEEGEGFRPASPSELAAATHR